MLNQTLKELTDLLGAKSLTSDAVIQGLSKDTRSLSAGNLYIAIIGENFDGHDYVEEARQKGASAALVSRAVDVDLPQILVPDTILALGKISKNWRQRFTLPLVGVTGSNGKTTLKNMIAAIQTAYCDNDKSCVLATEGNLNNHIGLPLMLASLNAHHRFGVIEMGMNQFDEISYLTQLTQPQVAVITNAAEAHLQGLKNIAGVAKAKGEIFIGLADNGIAVLNKDDTHYDYWRGLIKNRTYMTFGLQGAADVMATSIQSQDQQHQLLHVQTPKGELDINLPLLGEHNVKNAIAAVAVGIALDFPLPIIKKGLEAVIAAPGRMNQHILVTGTRLIDDTYNANPFSTSAAIKALAAYPGTKILVLADMRELGDNAALLHADIGLKAKAAGIDFLYTLGELTRETARTFGEKAQHFSNKSQLNEALQQVLKDNTTILIKGSRSMQMEVIVKGLLPHGASQPSH